MKAAHDHKGTGLFCYFCKPLGLVEGAGHGGDGYQVNRLFFQQCAEAVENTVVVVIFGHDNAFNIMLDGGRQIADADTVSYKSGKGGNDGLGSLNETEMVEICHRCYILESLIVHQ